MSSQSSSDAFTSCVKMLASYIGLKCTSENTVIFVAVGVGGVDEELQPDEKARNAISGKMNFRKMIFDVWFGADFDANEF